ncbi:MAG: hypothetical protein KC432_00930, partial [Thermomicrobiales bacterium]|nr:hypothetical protein [Thermomicrobiales bacterium]
PHAVSLLAGVLRLQNASIDVIPSGFRRWRVAQALAPWPRWRGFPSALQGHPGEDAILPTGRRGPS